MVKRATVLWTGGKDSALAFYEAQALGYDIVNLLTFAPSQPRFLAHPVSIMKRQADSIGLPHFIEEIAEPAREGYEKAILEWKKTHHIDALVTGDIAEVDGYPNWIRECSNKADLEVLTPLWGRDRAKILDQLIGSGFEVIFSLVKKPWLSEEWVGRRIDLQSIRELKAISAGTGLDICGENGEYHTLVLNAPYFRKPIAINRISKVVRDNLAYLEIVDLPNILL
jgi:diphthine-ammonia ligase